MDLWTQKVALMVLKLDSPMWTRLRPVPEKMGLIVVNFVNG
jgi:hypothetical protein